MKHEQFTLNEKARVLNETQKGKHYRKRVNQVIHRYARTLGLNQA